MGPLAFFVLGGATALLGKGQIRRAMKGTIKVVVSAKNDLERLTTEAAKDVEDAEDAAAERSSSEREKRG